MTEPAEWRQPPAEPDGPPPPDGPDPRLGWDTPPPPPPEPPRRRWSLRRWLLLAAACAVALALGLWALLGGGGLRYQLDPSLQDRLLTEADFSEFYTLTPLTQAQLDEAESPAAVEPDAVSPDECAELLNFSPPEVDATVPTAMVAAEGTHGDPIYVNAVFRLPDDLPDDAWDLADFTQVMDSCSSIDVESEGQSVHMTMSALDVDDLGGEAAAFVVGGSAAGQEVSIAVGMVQSGELLVMLVGVNPSDAIDGADFTDLLEVAVDRAG